MTNIPESFKRKAEEITQDLLDAKSNVRFKDKLICYICGIVTQRECNA